MPLPVVKLIGDTTFSVTFWVLELASISVETLLKIIEPAILESRPIGALTPLKSIVEVVLSAICISPVPFAVMRFAPSTCVDSSVNFDVLSTVMVLILLIVVALKSTTPLTKSVSSLVSVSPSILLTLWSTTKLSLLFATPIRFTSPKLIFKPVISTVPAALAVIFKVPCVRVIFVKSFVVLLTASRFITPVPVEFRVIVFPIRSVPFSVTSSPAPTSISVTLESILPLKSTPVPFTFITSIPDTLPLTLKEFALIFSVSVLAPPSMLTKSFVVFIVSLPAFVLTTSVAEFEIFTVSAWLEVVIRFEPEPSSTLTTPLAPLASTSPNANVTLTASSPKIVILCASAKPTSFMVFVPEPVV